ncbi:2,3-bisphosphoglycerate-independent phosphoglycerate mutase [Ferruginibacter yonginensis]|uniref:2,3-bisphosphoglycerate-independent phosphoglycerate mutase n=1 Tax=Ferruginibacter yonginensis TaxID=1310416 RepID=A0ABV8QQR6_9BACT
MQQKKSILIIMDGWGLGKDKASDAIQNAQVPFVTSLYKNYPNSTLVTCGEDVGLPHGQMGNSEVGHLNLGAGRIVYQDLERINVAIRQKTFEKNEALLNSINYAQTNNKTLHLMGLVSDGGVHAHIEHIKAITSLCASKNFNNVFIHAFTDGRDTDPKSGLGFLEDLQQHLNQTTGTIATVIGRYYAMDRDKRWERVRIAYDALVHATGTVTNDIFAAIQQSYDADVTDEFIMPLINGKAGDTTIKAEDAVLCFNFRTDRCREITEVLTQMDLPLENMHTIPLHYTTMANYDASYKNVYVMYDKDNLDQTLGEVIAAAGKTQLRIAETEKYPHVSFFFSGGREQAFEGETRVMVPSPKVATYDLQPEMSAHEVAEAAIVKINSLEPDFICLNFANADMVGHTGVWEAVIKAVEAVDVCVEKVVTAALEKDYCIFLLADHGNADYEINEDGSPNTAHTLNPVPFFVIDKHWRGTVKPGKLGDVAPTILKMIDLPIPVAMTGNVLI